MSNFWQGFTKRSEEIHKVYVARIFGGDTKNSAGGFYYSWGPTGKIKGRVSAGIDPETLNDMAKNPKKYLGRLAKVVALEKNRKKKLLQPEFRGWVRQVAA